MRLVRAGAAVLVALGALVGCAADPVTIPDDATPSANASYVPSATSTDVPDDALGACIAMSGFTIRPPDLDSPDPAARAKRTDEQLTFDIVQMQCHEELDPTPTGSPSASPTP